MTASFKIDQLEGAGEGTMGYARRSLWRDREITLTAYPAGSYAWALLDKPGGSEAQLEESELYSQVCHFTPDVNGTYRIRLVVGTQTMIRVARVDRDSSGARDGIWALPGFQEAVVEDNVDGNERGSAPVLESIFQDIWDGLESGGGGGGGGEPSGPAGGDLDGTYPNPQVAKLQNVILDWSTSSPPSDGLLKVRTETSPPGKHIDVLTPSSGYLQWTGSSYAWSSPEAAASPYVVYDPELVESTGNEYNNFQDAYDAAASLGGYPTIVLKSGTGFTLGSGTYDLQNRITIKANPAEAQVQVPLETGVVLQNPYQFFNVALMNTSENAVFETTTGLYNTYFQNAQLIESAEEEATWFAAPTNPASVVTFTGTGLVTSTRPLFDMTNSGANMYLRNSWEINAPVATGTEGSVNIHETSTGTHKTSPSYSGTVAVTKPVLALANHVIFDDSTDETKPPVYKTFSEAVAAAQALEGQVTLYVASSCTLDTGGHNLQSRIALVGVGSAPQITAEGSLQLQNPVLVKNLRIEASTDGPLFASYGVMSVPPLNMTLDTCYLVDGGLTTPWVSVTPSPAENFIRLIGNGELDTSEPFVDLGTEDILTLYNEWSTVGTVVDGSGTSELYLKDGPNSQYTQAPVANTVFDSTPQNKKTSIDLSAVSGTYAVDYESTSSSYITFSGTPSGDVTAVLSANYKNREVYVQNNASSSYVLRLKNENSTKTVMVATGQVRKLWVGEDGVDLRGEALDVIDRELSLNLNGYTVGNTDTVVLKVPALTMVDRVEAFLTESVAGGTAAVSVGTSSPFNQLLLATAVTTAGSTVGLVADQLGTSLTDVSGVFFSSDTTITVRVAVATATLTAGRLKVRVVGRYLGV